MDGGYRPYQYFCDGVLTVYAILMRTVLKPLLLEFHSMKKSLVFLAAFAALATTGAQAQDVYIGVGAPGLVSVGYAAPLSANWGWRAELAGGLNTSLNGNRDGVDVTGKLKSTSLSAFGDWFPFSGSGFRLVGGLSVNDTKADLNATGAGTATINGVTVSMVGQTYNVSLKYPNVTPYFGIGFGHQKAESGFGFYADLGVRVGTFDVTSNTTLVASNLGVTQADVDAQNQKMRDSVAKLSVLPSVSIGMLYRF
jgi:hypothetical protein